MENVDTNETVAQASKAEITTEPMEDSSHQSLEKGVERLTCESDDFVKNEGHVINENKPVKNTSHQNLVQHSNLNSLTSLNDFDSSTHLISAESTSSSFNADESVINLKSTLKEKEDDVCTGNVIKSNSGDTSLNGNIETQDHLGKDNDNVGEIGNLESPDNSTVTPVNESKSKGSDSILMENDHETPADRIENSNESPPENNVSTVEESSSEANKDPEEEWMDILGSGHLMKKVLTPGIPNSRPQKSDICVLNIVGCLEDGSIVEKHENLEINHSDNEVIQGLDFALALMDKGEVAEIKITPRFGYGSLGKRPEIPPGANLIYTVTLLDVKEEPPIHNLNAMDRIKNGLKKKERGNWWYSRDENTLAINCYRRALDYLDDTDIPEPHSEEDVHKLLEERLKTYNNLGAAQMKVSAFDAALMSVNNVLAAQPENVKALFRKAKILKEKGELQESINVIKQALSHEPESQTLQQELSSLMAAQRKVNSKQRELYKKMMGNSSNQPDEESKKKNNKNNYKTFTLVAAVSFAVAVLGTIVVKYKF
ncbi:peptidyl-prolyl cis-trans isomerase FKBP8 [Halyomorpha halys]|uniref:peptidyl-prolyl cis-trans isomerase FKBP8 n=1 Tax=Halyomorpha halys TaxID=286706 RepID=UPI0006D4D8C9|nr:peptidyl-prolyl cis-trans isomerase FKBP8 [Halyomorpha halys]